MRWPWHNLWIRAFPELALFETANERRNAFVDARRLPPSSRGFRFLMTNVIGFVALVVPMYLLPSGARRLRFALSLLLFVVGVMLLRLYFRNEIRMSLRQRLALEGVPICAKCGYELRGLTQPRCPECGSVFDPKLLHSIPDDRTRE